MAREGDPPDLVYLAAKSGKADDLQGLLQDKLSSIRLLGDQQKGQHTMQSVTVAESVEYIDARTGFTPLLAAVFYHNTEAAKLLLESGADVHNHGSTPGRTPLQLALADLSMDSKLIELLVSYGASPFLEGHGGLTPLDKAVQLRQDHGGPMPDALGSALLCLRRRCAFRGHLELKVDRYMGLSQTWRKFFCVLAPRERVVGHFTDMQLLVFSKNGFDRVTSIMMTHAAPIQVPVKAAHGRACFELVLSNKQMKKPAKLFARGDPSVGYSIYVRALSKDAVEARWLHSFIDLATSDPNKAMLNGDSEYQPPPRASLGAARRSDPVATSAQQLSQKQAQTSTDRKSASFSFSSDSAHVPQHRLPQLPEAADDQSEAHSRSPEGSDSSQAPASRPLQAPPPSTIQSHQAEPVSQADPPPPTLPHGQQGHSSASGPRSTQGASAERSGSTELWRSNAAFDGGKPIHGTTTYRSSLSLPSAKSFTSIDRQLTAHWRAKALQGLDLRESLDRTRAPLQLPAVSEHTSQPYQAQNPQSQQQQPAEPAVLPAKVRLSSNPIFSPDPHFRDSKPVQPSPTPAKSYIGLPAARAVAHHTDGSPAQHSYLPLPDASHHYIPQAQQQQQQQQQQQHDSAGRLTPRLYEEDDFEELELASAHQAVEDRAAQPAAHPPSAASVTSATPSMLIESNLEAARARSTMLDIPSAELLDSILDFANAVCGEPSITAASASPEAPPPERVHSQGQPYGSAAETQPHSHPVKRRPGEYSMMSQTSAASSVEPFSDDDDVTILDTTEVKKLAPQTLQVLPELPQPEPSRLSAACGGPAVQPSHLDGQEDLVYNMGPGPTTVPFHHYSLSPQLMEPPSPGAAARYGHLNRMYDTSMSDVSAHSASCGVQQAHHSPRHHSYTDGDTYSPAPIQPDFTANYPQSSMHDGSGSQDLRGGAAIDQQQYLDIVEQPFVAPQMEPVEFREMIDDIMALSEKQAAQVHPSGAAVASAASLHPIWEDEEVCLQDHEKPCVATIGVCVT